MKNKKRLKTGKRKWQIKMKLKKWKTKNEHLNGKQKMTKCEKRKLENEKWKTKNEKKVICSNIKN